MGIVSNHLRSLIDSQNLKIRLISAFDLEAKSHWQSLFPKSFWIITFLPKKSSLWLFRSSFQLVWLIQTALCPLLSLFDKRESEKLKFTRPVSSGHSESASWQQYLKAGLKSAHPNV